MLWFINNSSHIKYLSCPIRLSVRARSRARVGMKSRGLLLKSIAYDYSVFLLTTGWKTICCTKNDRLRNGVWWFQAGLWTAPALAPHWPEGSQAMPSNWPLPLYNSVDEHSNYYEMWKNAHFFSHFHTPSLPLPFPILISPKLTRTILFRPNFDFFSLLSPVWLLFHLQIWHQQIHQRRVKAATRPN